MNEILTQLAGRIGERPIGTDGNQAALDLVTARARELGYQVDAIPLACRTWRRGRSFLELGGERLTIHPGPFSAPAAGHFPVRAAQSLEELERGDLEGAVVLLHGPLAAEPLMPKEFPFYYPDEHRRIVELLEERRPAAVVALTGKHPMSGQDPHPLFEDGALAFPNAYASCDSVEVECLHSEPHERTARIVIDSASADAESRQPVFTRPGPDPAFVVCAHIDTKYGTPGAIDNAAGVAVMVGIMERLRSAELGCRVDFVPFNGEEYYGVPGQLAYLAAREPVPANTRLVVNLDGLGYPGSRNAVSRYNAGDELNALVKRALRAADRATPGDEWVAGDHSMFVFAGIPCVAVTSSTMHEMLAVTHTEADTTDKVDPSLLAAAADLVTMLIRGAVG
ncbi:MAG: M28 family peptidase [Spirochaetota bacterium]